MAKSVKSVESNKKRPRVHELKKKVEGRFGLLTPKPIKSERALNAIT